MTIGFIGFGEAASSMAVGFSSEGLSEIYAFDSLQKLPENKELFKDRTKNSSVEFLETSGELAEKADVVFSAVPADCAVAAASDTRDYLCSGKLYIDVTTASPEEKQEISDIVTETGALFVDGAMMGSLPKEKHRVPILASGNGTEKFSEIMAKYNMNITEINSLPGAATSIKYLRSIMTKGIACLLIESLQAAKKYSVERIVVDSISESLDKIPFEQTIDRYVSGTINHSKRRIHEIENVLAALGKADIDLLMTRAVKEKLSWIDSLDLKEQFNNNVPEKWDQIVQDWGI